MTTTSSYQVTVIGAGISGLVCAYRLAKAGKSVAVVESSSLVGGVIRSEHRDGYLLEHGPSSMLAKASALSLLEELDVFQQAQIKPMSQHARYVWRRGKLRIVPTGRLLFVCSTLLSLREKYEVLHGFTARFRPPTADVALGAYCRERFGDGVVQAILKPALAGIYAADADRISLQSIAPKLFPLLARCERLWQVPKELKTLSDPAAPNGERALISFPEGLAELTEYLECACEREGALVLTGGKVEQLTRHADGWRVHIEGGEALDSDAVVLTQPANAAASLLREAAPATAAALDQVEHVPLAVVHVGLQEGQLGERRRGFGFLTVQNEGVRALGAIWNDRIFGGRAPANHRLLTWFYGGEIDPDVVALDDAELRKQVVADMKTTIRFRGDEFSLFNVTRYRSALPVFRVGHMERMKDAVHRLPAGIELLGSYLGGVSIPDRIERATEMAERLIARDASERTTAAA